jgi:hypothetical protein
MSQEGMQSERQELNSRESFVLILDYPLHLAEQQR